MDEVKAEEKEERCNFAGLLSKLQIEYTKCDKIPTNVLWDF